MTPSLIEAFHAAFYSSLHRRPTLSSFYHSIGLPILWWMIDQIWYSPDAPHFVGYPGSWVLLGKAWHFPCRTNFVRKILIHASVAERLLIPALDRGIPGSIHLQIKITSTSWILADEVCAASKVSSLAQEYSRVWVPHEVRSVEEYHIWSTIHQRMDRPTGWWKTDNVGRRWGEE